MNNVVFIFTTLLGFTFAADWSYDYETQWPGQCRSGTAQSPINIMTGDALVDQFGAHIRGPLVFRGYGDVRLHAKNTGHTLKWENVEESEAPVLSGGPLRGNYTFLQFHLHWLSEHAIDGMKYPLEIHMVHKKTGISIAEALKRPDGLAVIGVLALMATDGRSTHALDHLVYDMPHLFHRSEEPIESSLEDISQLFSPDPQSFYTYHGSLTTPNCEEVVTWIVMDKPILISQSQYQLFNKVDFGRMDNYRSLQPANRVVYRSVASCASVIAPSFFALFASSFQCLALNLYSVLKKTLCKLHNIKKNFYGGVPKDCLMLN